MPRSSLVLFLTAAVVGRPTLAVQDTTNVEGGVSVGITYRPGVRPGLLMFGGARADILDSVRTIVRRDLEHSDEFEMINLPAGDSLVLRIGMFGSEAEDETSARSVTDVPLNYPLYSFLGADFAVNVHLDFDSSVVVTLFDVRGQSPVAERRLRLDPRDRDFRMRIHQAADELLQVAVGRLGIAATRVLLVSRGRVYRVDIDGADLRAMSSEGGEALSPVFSPDGRRVVYMEFPGTLYEHDVATGQRAPINLPIEGQKFTPAYAPDAQTLAFALANGEGTHIYTYNLADQCCLQRLTVGRLFDNLSPTYSPDGRRIAYVSNRPGSSQIYVMQADGTQQELFAPFDWGVFGASNGPEWSPDGRFVAFHRDVSGSPQIFIMEVGTQVVRQLTSLSRNTDPTWAPDSRHMAFVSERTGSRQIWIIDVETGGVRQLTRLGEARLPEWSPRIAVERN